MSIYNRIAGIEGKKIGVWPLLNDTWLVKENILTWAQVKQRFELSTEEFQELKSWFQALMDKSDGSHQGARSKAHQLFIAIERHDGEIDPITNEVITPYRISEQQVLTYLGL